MRIVGESCYGGSFFRRVMEGSYSAQLMLCVGGAEYLMFGGALQYVWTVPAISQVSGQISRRMIGTPCTTSRSIPFASIAGAPTMSCTPFAPALARSGAMGHCFCFCLLACHL